MAFNYYLKQIVDLWDFFAVTAKANVTQSGHTYTSTIRVGPLDYSMSKVEYSCLVQNDYLSESKTKQFLLPGN